MKIGIIGAGNIGGTLTRRFAALGHAVSVANSRGPETLRDLAAETGATAVSVTEAARDKDVVVVTIPEKNVPDLPDDLFADAGDIVVVDTGNYYPQQRDGRIDAIDDGMAESRWVEQQLGRPVIKAFNNIYADHLRDNGRPADTPGRIALPVAGDDDTAKAVVMELIDELGFDAVDAGSLDQSWRQQPGTPVYTKDLDADGVRRALSEASPQRSPQWRATPHSPGGFTDPR
ncbi:MAG: putative dinucleotide-binding enzyme [Pseudonocardiales bacterium]|jgi:predicted dinucleotide-binding enzyme|nr:putative dinucleotide-binding enzyme [Pseudonocardiales bacterium]